MPKVKLQNNAEVSITILVVFTGTRNETLQTWYKEKKYKGWVEKRHKQTNPKDIYINIITSGLSFSNMNYIKQKKFGVKKCYFVIWNLSSRYHISNIM